MDEFKISLFESEYKTNFPQYRELTKEESQELAYKICERYGITMGNLEIGLASKQSFYNECDSLDNFELIDTLTKIGIKSMNKIFVNWYKFERVDVLNVHDIDKYFYDIWFPGSDDIDLFDNSLNWIVSIRHDGVISYTKQN